MLLESPVSAVLVVSNNSQTWQSSYHIYGECLFGIIVVNSECRSNLKGELLMGVCRARAVRWYHVTDRKVEPTLEPL